MDLQCSEIGADRSDRRGGVIHKVDQAGTAAESLNAHRSRAGVEIREDSAIDTCGQNIKKSFT